MRDQGSNEDEAERILRALADEAADGSLPAPDDERLRAYREGRLAPEETREMEVLLARSDAGRRRLLELAGIDRSLPLRRVRKAVLGQERRRATAWMSTPAIAAIAAALVLALAAILSQSRGLPEGLTYEVSARGLAEVRSGEAAPDELRAYPATTLRIFLRPRGEVSAGVSFALYRREGAALRRVREPEEVTLASERGSATFSGTAARVLATEAPGVHTLFALVAAEEDFPSTVDIAPGQDPAGSLRASGQDTGRLVYPVTVTLLRKEGTP